MNSTNPLHSVDASSDRAIAARYCRLRPRAIRVALGITGDRDLAEDLYHDAYTAALRQERTVGRRPVGDAYIIESVRRLALRHRRDDMNRRRLLARRSASSGCVRPSSLVEELSYRRAAHALDELISSWTPFRRDVFRLCFYERCSSQDAAELTGRSRRAVEKQRAKIQRDLDRAIKDRRLSDPWGGEKRGAGGSS